jgi:RNA polymerase sigma-70 factor (ECF subfamily)
MDAQSIHDETLMRQVLKENKVAFEILYKRYYPRIRGLCRKMTQNETDADDLTQEVLTTVFKKRKQFSSDKGTFKQWIFTIAINQCKNAWKKKKREITFANEMSPITFVPLSKEIPGYALEQWEIQELLKASLNALKNPMEKDVLRLYYYEGMKYREISQIFGCSIRTIGNWLESAKRNLRTQLKAAGITASDVYFSNL